MNDSHLPKLLYYILAKMFSSCSFIVYTWINKFPLSNQSLRFAAAEAFPENWPNSLSSRSSHVS